MGEDKAQSFQDSWSQYFCGDVDPWKGAMNDHHQDHDSFVTYSSSLSQSPATSTPDDSSTMSNGSSSSSSSSSSLLDITDDAASSSPHHSSFSNSTESLYDFSELMDKLPIKRGLSKFYQGKSESFTSLSKVTSLDDLKKKETPYKRKTKANKSYGAGLDKYKSFNLPKPTICKKTPRASLFSSSFPSKRVIFVSRNSPPQIPPQKH